MKTHAPKTRRSFAYACALQGLFVTTIAAQAQTSSPFERTVSGSAGHWQRYSLEIPAGTTSLAVTLSGGSGDADLYVRSGEQPSETSYDCRPYKDSTDELCTVENPSAGTWHLGIRGYSEFSEVQVKATWSAAAPAPAPAPEPAPAPTPAPDWKQQILDRHNLYRAQHCAPELAWDEQVAATAQEWANRCVWDHDAATPFGENLAYRSVQQSPLTTIDAWYAESANYDFTQPGTSANTGHFTQVVWNGSTRIGCARAECPFSAFGDPAEWGMAYLYVCRYADAGNTTGRYAENVKPKSDGGVCE